MTKEKILRFFIEKEVRNFLTPYFDSGNEEVNLAKSPLGKIIFTSV